MARAIVLVAGKDPLSEIGGGHSRYVRAHARAAVRAGFTPHLFCVGRRAGTVDTDYGVVRRIASPFWPYRQLMIGGHGPLLAAGITRFVRDERRPVLIHSFGVWGYVGVAASRRLRARGLSVVPVLSSYTTYEAEARSNGERDANRMSPFGDRVRYRAEHLWIRMVVERYERVGYMGSALVLFNYESVRRLLLAKYPVTAQCRRIPYASESAFLDADASLLAEVPDAVARLQPREAPLVLTVSRHQPRKGVHVLIHALARLRAAGVPFRACLIGEGSLLPAHRRLAGALGLDGRVAITGTVPDPRPYLRHADVFVLPSLAEQSGSLALIEALQAGLPVVASRCDGIPEDVADEDSALLVRPGDEVALSDAIGRLLRDGALRSALGARARQVFREKFSADGLVKALGETYADLGFCA